MTLYNGENFSEDQSTGGSFETYPFRKDKFGKQVINVRVMNFEFQRRDENIFRNSHRMLNINQLRYAEDSLLIDYKDRLRNFLLSTRYTGQADKRLYARALDRDSILQTYDLEPRRIFDYDSLVNSFQQLNMNEPVQAALYSARSNYQEINNVENNLYGRKKRINMHMMERHRKFTLSFAVFIFFFIGAPLGAIIRKGGLGMPVVVSILLFISYYIFSMTGEKSAREDVWEMFSGMWFSSFVFLPVGFWLTYKAVTDSPVMSAETYTNFIQRIKRMQAFKPFKKYENPPADQ